MGFLCGRWQMAPEGEIGLGIQDGTLTQLAVGVACGLGAQHDP